MRPWACTHTHMCTHTPYWFCFFGEPISIWKGCCWDPCLAQSTVVVTCTFYLNEYEYMTRICQYLPAHHRHSWQLSIQIQVLSAAAGRGWWVELTQQNKVHQETQWDTCLDVMVSMRNNAIRGEQMRQLTTDLEQQKHQCQVDWALVPNKFVEPVDCESSHCHPCHP